MENQTDQNSNPTPPILPIDQASPAPNIEKPLGSPEKPAKAAKSKLPILIIGIIIFLLIAGSAAGFYAFKPQIMKLASKPTPTPNIPLKQPHKNLNPNTGNLYEDMKVRLKEELK